MSTFDERRASLGWSYRRLGYEAGGVSAYMACEMCRGNPVPLSVRRSIVAALEAGEADPDSVATGPGGWAETPALAWRRTCAESVERFARAFRRMSHDYAGRPMRP